MRLKHISIWIAFIYLSSLSTLSAQKSDSHDYEIHPPLEYNIVHYSKKDGLSGNRIFGIHQDKLGYIWICTLSGLNRFDGYKFKKYSHIPGDSTSLASSVVWSILEDKYGQLWVANQNGLSLYNREYGSFANFYHNPYDSLSLSSSYIRPMFEDHLGRIWLGTENGLNRLERRTMTFKRYLTGKVILSICEVNNEIWAGTEKRGIFKYDSTLDKAIRPKVIQQFPVMNKISVVSLLAVNQYLWIGTWGYGGYQLDLNTSKIIHMRTIGSVGTPYYDEENQRVWTEYYDGIYHYNNQGLDKKKIEIIIQGKPYPRRKKIVSFNKDDAGSMWIGTDGDGLFHLSKIQPGIKIYRVDNNKLYYGVDLADMLYDRDDCLWYSTWYEGIYRLSKNRTAIEDPFPNLIENKDWLYPKTMICQRDNDEIWFSSRYGGGVFRYKRNVNEIDHISIVNNLSFEENFVLFEDKQFRFWMGVQNNGLNLYDEIRNNVLNFRHDPGRGNSLSSNQISSIADADSGRLWVATTGGGLNLFDPENNTAIHFKLRHGNKNSLSDDRIHQIHASDDSTLWIATTTGGLNKFNTKTRKFKHYSTANGLPNNTVNSVISDNNGDIWLATEQGLVHLDPESDKLRIYDHDDGLISMEFYQFCQSPQGELFIGHVDGFTSIIPDSLKDNPYIPPVVLTSFQILNRPAKLDTVIEEKKHIVLNHNQNIISFEYAALNYIVSKKNQYRYKMDGFDQNWVEAGNRRFASYTNLVPGSYTFKVMGSNNDGIWNEKATSVKITILPPWWRTTVAYISYIILIIIILYALRQYDLKRQRLRHQLALEKEQAEKLLEIDHMKSRFFANISHEFRTPLTLILGPLKKLLDNIPARTGAFGSELKAELSLMQRNARRLYRLINQLLDLPKLEAGGMTLQVNKVNIVELIYTYAQSFESLAKQEGIRYVIDCPKEEIEAYVDQDKIEKILNNLLSNAFKFTPAGGLIKVAVSSGRSSNELQNATATDDFIIITVSDTGIGIPPDRIDKIFDRFYQVDDSQKREHEGSGIGLALVKELVELHHGHISVQSEAGKGSTFTVSIPLGKEHFKESNQITSSIQTDKPDSEMYPVTEPESVENEIAENITADSDQPEPIILVVEDNADMRTYICNHLKSDYKLLEANNGIEGVDKAQTTIPDLIISDVMMPKMDGYTFCTQIKSDEKTSHIPVILLTARAAKEDKLTGLETGADDYVAKPFEADELKVRVKNLINQRVLLRKKFSASTGLRPEDIAVTSADEKFLTKALQISEQNMSDPEFGVDKFRKEIALSRVQLHRKLHALTDQSTSEFVRSIRLNRAAQLLKRNADTITQIAYEVGFKNPSYFSSSFQKQFGVLPKEYLRQQSRSN